MSQSNAFREVLGLLMNPVETLAEFWDFLQHWLKSRNWKFIFGFLFITLCVPFLIASLVIAGRIGGKNALLIWYAELAEKESVVESSGLVADASGDSDQDKSSSEAALLYYRRVLQLENDNKRAKYFVAVQHAKSGSLTQARKWMNSLAPFDHTGYMPAHAWLALDLLRQKRLGTQVSEEKLRHHFERISTWNEAPPELLLASAQYMGEVSEFSLAIALAKQAVRREPEFALDAAVLVMALGEKSTSEQFTEIALHPLMAKIEKSEATEKEYLNAAQAYILKSQISSAIDVLLKGIQVFPESVDLRKALAQSYVEQFVETLVDDKTTFAANWTLLEGALAANPYSREVSQQFGELEKHEILRSDQFADGLRKQLAEGKAVTVSNLLLAMIAVKESDFEQGRHHLAIAAKLSPYASIVLGRYAEVLSLVSPPDFKKARDIIEEALGRDPANVDLLLSKGKILLRDGDVSNAIPSLEKAAELGPRRKDVGESLLEAYEKSGMTEKVMEQKSKLESIDDA